jgi:hypothetical protein
MMRMIPGIAVSRYGVGKKHNANGAGRIGGINGSAGVTDEAERVVQIGTTLFRNLMSIVPTGTSLSPKHLQVCQGLRRHHGHLRVNQSLQLKLRRRPQNGHLRRFHRRLKSR